MANALADLRNRTQITTATCQQMIVVPRNPSLFADSIPFFKIEHVRSGDKIGIGDKVLGFKVEEKLFSLPMMDLQIQDNSMLLGKLYRFGAKVEMSWGYRKTPGLALLGQKGEIITQRGPQKGYVLNSNYICSDGKAILNLTLQGTNRPAAAQPGETRTEGAPSVDTTVTEGTVANHLINVVTDEIGGIAHLSFQGSLTRLTTTNPINRSKQQGAHGHVVRIAKKFKASVYLFHDDKNGKPVYVIADENGLASFNTRQLRGLRPDFPAFDYVGTNSNIIRVDFNTNFNSPFGSLIRPTIGPNGKITAIRVRAPDQKIRTWRINWDKINREARGGNATEILQRILNADFEEFRTSLLLEYFIPDTQTTAPEGFGFLAKARILPDPSLQIGDRIVLGPVGDFDSLVPPQFRTRFEKRGAIFQVVRNTLWFIIKSVHTFGATGYKMEITARR